MLATPLKGAVGGVYDLENPAILAAVTDLTRGRTADILDIGCDTGRLMLTLRTEHGQRVFGLDNNLGALDLAVARGLPVLNFDVVGEWGLPFPDDSFDGAILGDVIEHVRDPELLLGRVARTVVVGGFIVVSVPNVAFIETRVRLLFGRFDYRQAGTLDRGHLRFFTRKTLVDTLERAGLVVEAMRPYTANRSVQFLRPLWRLMPGLFAYQILAIARKPR